jgi:transcription initiation factor TFIID subunit TAF12
MMCQALHGSAAPPSSCTLTKAALQVQAQEEEQQQSQQEQGQQQQVTRRYALGCEVVEQSEPFPEPPAQDMWEGEAWEVCAAVPGFSQLTCCTGASTLVVRGM